MFTGCNVIHNAKTLVGERELRFVIACAYAVNCRLGLNPLIQASNHSEEKFKYRFGEVAELRRQM